MKKLVQCLFGYYSTNINSCPIMAKNKQRKYFFTSSFGLMDDDNGDEDKITTIDWITNQAKISVYGLPNVTKWNVKSQFSNLQQWRGRLLSICFSYSIVDIVLNNKYNYITSFFLPFFFYFFSSADDVFNHWEQIWWNKPVSFRV